MLPASENGPSLADVLQCLLTGTDAASTYPADEREDPAPESVRAAVVARLRGGPLSLRDSVLALDLLERVGDGGATTYLADVLADRAVHPTARACALTRLAAVAPAEVLRVTSTFTPAEFGTIGDARFTLDMLMHLPAPAIADGLAALLARAPAGTRGARFGHLEACRAAAGLPAALAYRVALVAPELAELRPAILDALAAAPGSGTRLILGHVRASTRDAALRAQVERVLATLLETDPSALPQDPRAGYGFAIDVPGEPAQTTTCVLHPQGLAIVGMAAQHDDALRVDGLFVMPFEPMLEPHNALAAASASKISLADAAARIVPTVQRAAAAGRPLGYDVVALVCVLDAARVSTRSTPPSELPS